MSYERMKDKVNESLKTHFRPEFLNRIDETIVFHELSRDEVLQTVDLLTQRLVGQLEGQGLGIEIKQSAKELLAELGYDPQLGARPMRRAIQRHIEDCAVGEDPVQGVLRRRDHRRRHRGRSGQPGQAAVHVHRRRGLRAAVVGRAGDHRHRESDTVGR